MEIGLRDVVYIGVYAVTVATMWTNFQNQLKNTQKETEKISSLVKKLMFSETGDLNFVDKRTCKEIQYGMQVKIEKGQETTAKAFERLEEMNQNIILIMYHLKIDRDDIDRRPRL